jgi:hypothetical protein
MGPVALPHPRRYGASTCSAEGRSATSDAWRVAFRTESFDDKDGFRTGVNLGTGGQKWKESTITLANTPAKNVELRAELRTDSSNVSSFNQTDGSTKKSQHSAALEAIYKF